MFNRVFKRVFFHMEHTPLPMLHRWNLLTQTSQIKNCGQKIESCSSMKWNDYGFVETKTFTPKTTIEHEYIDMVNYKQISSDELVMRASMSL